IPLLVLAGLVKYAAFLLVPVFLLHLFRRGYPPGRLMLSVAIALAAGWIVLWPLWAGSATIDGISQLENMMTMSPGATLVMWARSFGYEPAAAETTARHLMTWLFLEVYLVTLLTVDENTETALVASFLTLIAMLVFVTFWFRPWYIVWPLAIAAVLIGQYKWLATAGITFSAVGLLVYLFTDYLWVWFGTDLKLHQYLMLAVFLPPLLVLCAGAIASLIPGLSSAVASKPAVSPAG